MKMLNIITNTFNSLTTFIYSMLDWIVYLFWEIGWMTIQLLKGNINGTIEMLYWIRIHLTYDGKYISKTKLSLTQIIKNICIEIVGLIVTLGILFLTIMFILLIMTMNY